MRTWAPGARSEAGVPHNMTDEPQQHGDGDRAGDGTTSRQQEAGTSRRDEGNERKEPGEGQRAARKPAGGEQGRAAGAEPEPRAGAARAAKPVPGAEPDAAKAGDGEAGG
ncbi:hypothetical protein G3I42_01755, partial [Streptomyces sp. SID11385]|nr:hypothetical protein [Streptomyces sp. SID11385]